MVNKRSLTFATEPSQNQAMERISGAPALNWSMNRMRFTSLLRITLRLPQRLRR